MSFTGPSVGSEGRTARRAFEFGRTYVVRPKAEHQATVVWLHGLGDNGSRKLAVGKASRHISQMKMFTQISCQKIARIKRGEVEGKGRSGGPSSRYARTRMQAPFGMGTEWRAAKSPAYYKHGDYVLGLKAWVGQTLLRCDCGLQGVLFPSLKEATG